MPAIARNSVDLPAPDGPVTSTWSRGRERDAVGRDQRRAGRQRDVELVEPDLPRAAVAATLDRRRASRRSRVAGRDRGLEAREPRDHGAPFGELRDRR